MQSGKLLPPPPSITYKTVLLYQISRIDYIKYKIYTKNSSKNQRFFSSLIFSSLVHRVSTYLKKYINVSRQSRELITDNRIYVYIRLFQNQYSAEYQYTRYTFARSRRKTKQFAPYRCQTLNGTYAYANVREFSGPLEAGGIDAAILMERTRPWKFCVHRESGREERFRETRPITFN